jgi:hypothetical protein
MGVLTVNVSLLILLCVAKMHTNYLPYYQQTNVDRKVSTMSTLLKNTTPKCHIVDNVDKNLSTLFI